MAQAPKLAMISRKVLIAGSICLAVLLPALLYCCVVYAGVREIKARAAGAQTALVSGRVLAGGSEPQELSFQLANQAAIRGLVDEIFSTINPGVLVRNDANWMFTSAIGVSIELHSENRMLTTLKVIAADTIIVGNRYSWRARENNIYESLKRLRGTNTPALLREKAAWATNARG
jgi:hypothetical protein